MSTLTPSEAVEKASGFDHAVVSFLDANGYPMTVAGAFRTDLTHAVVQVGPLDPSVLPAQGQEVGLLFSRIRPQPGIGYDERRYVNAWGTAQVQGDMVVVAVERATGWDEAEVPFFEYAERTLPEAKSYMAELGAKPRLSVWWTFFLTTRLPFLTATIVPVALGGAVAARDHRFGWGWFLLALLGGVLIHLGLNMVNDLFDDASGADAANVTPTPFSGGSRVLQYGLVSRRAVVVASTACYALGITIGLSLAAARGWGLLAIGAVGVVISLAYSAPPLKLVHRGLGEVTTALGFGPVTTLGTYYVCAQRFSGEAFFVSLPVAVLIALILYVNEIPDRAGDAAVGKRTLPVRWPKDRVVAMYAAAAALAYVLVVVGVIARITPAWTLLALLTVPMARKVHVGLVAHYDRPYELMGAMQANIGLHLVTGLLLVAGYVIDLIAR
ncbi:MAG: 1,4-dihydroxy-2-naphthoate polyprenyltransferase [Actinomycetota bacterium]|jgi:1,4-dihydroxy-2-naphthoate octaprenyltransferase